MKRLFLLSLACMLGMNLLAKPYSPVEAAVSRTSAKEQFQNIYNYYRKATSSFMFEKLETVKQLKKSLMQKLFSF